MVELADPAGGRAWPLRGESLGLAFDAGATASQAAAVGRERAGTVFGALAGLLRCSVRGATVVPVVRLDRERLTAALAEVALAVNVLPTNASLSPRSGEVREGRPGRLLDPSATGEAILAAVAASLSTGSGAARVPGVADGGLGGPALEPASPAPGPETLAVAIEFAVTPPRGDVARLTALDRDLLGSFTTSYDTSEEGRSWNIALAAARLDGTIIEPGEAVSFNGLVGAREPEAGFREAPEIVNNELVPGYGGGVCQAATTVFNAALLADLDIAERYHHSRPLAYIGLGRDATVSYPALDLVVRNSKAFPVILVAGVSGGRVTVSFWGRRTVTREVRLWVEELNLEPAQCLLDNAAKLPAGEVEVVKQPFDGRDVRLWRQVAEGGQVVRKELVWVDHYEPIAGLIRVGPRPAAAPATGSAGTSPGDQSVEESGSGAGGAGSGGASGESESSDPQRPGR